MVAVVAVIVVAFVVVVVPSFLLNKDTTQAGSEKTPKIGVMETPLICQYVCLFVCCALSITPICNQFEAF